MFMLFLWVRAAGLQQNKQLLEDGFTNKAMYTSKMFVNKVKLNVTITVDMIKKTTYYAETDSVQF